MKTTSVLSAAALCLLASACADTIPVEPSATLSTFSSSAALAEESDEVAIVSSGLDEMNARLAAAGAPLRFAKAELRFAGVGYEAATSTIVFANDRARGIGAEWVKGDPRRNGRTGVTYAVGSNSGGLPFTLNADWSAIVPVPAAQVDAQIEEGMQAWRNRSCSAAGIERVAGGANPDLFDEIYRGYVPMDWTNPADIVQGMWQPRGFFQTLAMAFGMPAAEGDFIIGITLSAYFVDDEGNYSDIDRNGKADIGLAEIYYNRFVGVTPQGQILGYLWSNDGAPGFTDFYSIIAHETGHALGLNHFGKVFVTKKATEDGQLTVDEVKYAPEALMNAVYITGRNEIRGTDNSSFCMLWSSRKK